MSYIGAEPTTAAFPFDQFSGNGTTTAFTLTYAPASTTSIIVAISGVVQNPNLYSVIGTTITFSPAPPTGTNNISVLYLGLPVQIGTPIPGSRLELALGSAANPSLTFLGDTNTGIFSPAADTIAFAEGGTEVARFDSSGQLGIGTSSPSTRLDVAGNVRSSSGTAYATMGVAGGAAYLQSFDTSITNIPLTFFVGSTERMRIDSSGNLLVGNTVTVQGSRAEFTSTSLTPSLLARSAVAADAGQWTAQFQKTTTTNTTSQIFIRFLINDGATPSGFITANGANAATFTSSSDERLKENIVDLPSQLSNIMSLRPVEFDYKDGSGHQIGFIAQEMQTVYPDCVEKGIDDYLMIGGWSKTEARLIKALQELKAELDATKAEVALLKGAA
jgi:hypothetical protein